jgi:hypothetical protein
MITKQQLENAARAMGLQEIGFMGDGLTHVVNNQFVFWQPEQPTTQGKADLLDLMLALNIYWDEENTYISAWKGFKTSPPIPIINNNKHAALAEAVVSVASLIWESKNA